MRQKKKYFITIYSRFVSTGEQTELEEDEHEEDYDDGADYEDDDEDGHDEL